MEHGGQGFMTDISASAASGGQTSKSREARVLVFSHYQAFLQRHMALNYDFAQVIAEVEAADILTPPAPANRFWVETDKAVSLASRKLKLGPRAHIQSAQVENDYDLFIMLASFPRDVSELRRLKDWRRRCKQAVLVVNETWLVSLQETQGLGDLFAQFDRIYTAVPESIPLVEQYLKWPIHPLPTGLDVLFAAPYPHALSRIYDVYAMGRTPDALKQQLTEADSRGELSFLFDVVGSPFAILDFNGHRINKAAMIKRAKYFPCYAVRAFENRKKGEAGAFDMIPFRFYEGAAAGCVLFGVAPACGEFKTLFAWQDAVIECPPDHPDFLGFLLDLDRDQDRIAAIRARNVAGSMRLNDWVYRYERILSDAGLSLPSQLIERKQLLAETAQTIERTGLPEAPKGRFHA
jgi:hypothetical protein